MYYGTRLGLLLVIFSLIVWIMGVDEKSSIPSIINNLLIVGFLFYSITYYRDNRNHRFISYAQSLKLGTSIAFFSSLITAFYTLLYLSYLNPDILSNILVITEQSALQSNPEISNEELEQTLEITQNLMKPHWLMILGVLGGTFMGFFYSLIISLFVRRTNSNTIE